MEKIFKQCRHTLIALGLLLGLPTIALAQAAPTPSNPSYSTQTKFGYGRFTQNLEVNGPFNLTTGGSVLAGTIYASILPVSTLGQNTILTIPDPGTSTGYFVLGAGTDVPRIVNHIQFQMTVANVTGMNGTPVSVIAAVTGKTIVLDDVFMTYTEAGGAYASGGTVDLLYHGGNVATGTVAATAITAASGSTYSAIKPVSVIGLISTGIDITNNTGAFTQSAATGAPLLDIYYHLQ